MSGQQSSGQGAQKSSSSSSSAGTSTSTSHPQMTTAQLLNLYGSALPSVLSTASNATSSSPTAPALQAANKGAVQGVNAINLNGLSPGEANAVQRSTNQTDFGTGNLGNSNATNTIKNAMNFGGAFNNKIPLLNASTNTAAGVSNAGSNALGTTSALFSPIAASANAPVSASNSIFSSAGGSTGVSNSSNNSLGFGIGCFLTTAVCQWKGLPDDCEELTVLRAFRDKHVPFPLIEEYYRIAPRIVDKIKNTPSILEYIYMTVEDCVVHIKLHHYDSALNRYKLMVENLKEITDGCI